MHHANCDRVWHDWQNSAPGGMPPGLSGANAVFDPWTETETDVLDIQNLGYTYV